MGQVGTFPGIKLAYSVGGSQLCMYLMRFFQLRIQAVYLVAQEVDLRLQLLLQ
jgi:hypothetical protein